MRIKEIEIDNFKSFKFKTNIPFLDGFTTISGPNGSGKSNIIDCILFALGLSTSKTLRAEKLSDLINNNSSKREASVVITFADDENSQKEFQIKRKIKEISSGYISTYYLNGHPTTLTEIHKTLSDYNISPGGFNVMMQGDVTGIINMSAMERRKIIDELAGVAEFDRRIDQAKQEIDTVNDRIERSNIILGEIDARIEQLSTERDLALKYQKLKEEKQTLVNQISLVRYKELKNSINVVQENIEDLTKEKLNLTTVISEIEKQLLKIKQELDELNEKVKTKGEEEYLNLTRQSETLKGEIYRKKQQLELNQKQISENKSTIEKALREINNLNETIDDTQLKIENKQEQYNILENQLEKERNDLKKLLNESSNLNQTTQDFIEKRNILRRDLETTEDNKGRLERENLKWEEIKKRLETEYTTLKNDLDTIEDRKNSLVSNSDNLIKEIRHLEDEKSACEIQLNTSINNIKFIKTQITEVDEKIQKIYRKKVQIEANKAAAEEANLGKTIETVLNSGITGIHKTLSQLACVPDKYSLALETAMGGRMKSIVVDNEHVGAEAINYLKRLNAGRATFLPLNKIKYYLPSTKLPNIDGVIDFAINLVKFDSIYKNAFFFALGETLVVENIEIAKLLMGEYRIVTLDGALVEKTGAMTGGSSARNTLKFASSYDNELTEITNLLKNLKNEKTLYLNNLETLEKKLDKFRDDYSKILNTIHMKKLDLENTQNSLNNFDLTHENNKNKISEITTKIEEATIEIGSIKEKFDESANKVSNLKKEIEIIDTNIPKDKLEELEELTGNVEYEIKSIETKLRNLENDIKKASMEKDFKEQSQNYQKDKIEECNINNERIKVENEKINIEINIIQTKVDDLINQISQISIRLKEYQNLRDKVSKDLLDFQNDQNKVKHSIYKVEETISASVNHKKDLLVQLNKLKSELKENNIDYLKVNILDITIEKLNKSIDKLTRQMESLEPVNMLAIKEYEEVQERKEELSLRINTLTNEKNQIGNRLTSYESLKKESFIVTFNNVDKNFREIFNSLSEGEGYLVLENKEDPFKGGLIIEARPRDKKLLRIEAMSGGEKSLTALAFVFAFQRYMPAPFYAFDEVDMFLDGVNVEKLAEMIKTQSSNAQFIVVSLRKPMIERAKRTVGVTQRNDGITKVTGVKLHE